MKNLVICGDSFSIGIGCHDLNNEPYGSLLAKKLGMNLINLAKGSSTNLSISLQVKHAVDNIPNIGLLIVANTCYHRTEWFPENAKENSDVNNLNVNYHQYPPYGEGTYPYIFDHPMIDDPRYTGEILTENWYGIIDYVENILDKNNNVNNSTYFKKFKTERPEKMRLLKDYYYEFFDSRIQRQYDMGVIVKSHALLKNRDINHFILTHDHEFPLYVPNENLVHVDWGELSLKYPDDLKTLHTSYLGQIEVYESIMKKLEGNGII
jgi:hypothetical protein